MATARVFIAAENRLLREALGRMLNRRGGIEVIGSDSAGPFQSNDLLEGQVDVLLLISGGDLEEDLAIVRKAHSAAPGAPILVIGATLENGGFYNAGGRGSAVFVARGIRRRCCGGHQGSAGEAVCPGTLCTALFRYFEQESSPVPCAGVRQRIGFTRREQQFIPLIARA
jgi:DNA-binding NarL/FixJ family response regulator